MGVLQETWHNDSESLVVYESVSVASMEMVMSGGDHTLVGLLPSGYVILSNGSGDEHKFFVAITSDGEGHGGMVKDRWIHPYNGLPNHYEHRPCKELDHGVCENSYE
ncbi:hypothetical protein LINGRAHAP2_LOCUS22525 [Linum grandiflorum]